MKTITAYILVFICMVFTSCSDSTNESPDNVPDAVIITADGVQKTFTNVQVTESTYIEADQNIPTYNVLATFEEDTGEYIAFQVERNFTGNGGLYAFIYGTPQDTYTIADNFTFTVNTNTTSKLSGNFSGPLFDASGTITPSVVITNGSFDIYY